MTLPRKGDRVRVTASAEKLSEAGIIEPLPIGALGEVQRTPLSVDSPMYVRFETGLECYVWLGDHVEIAICPDCNNHGVIPGGEPGLSEPCGNPFHAPIPEKVSLTDCLTYRDGYTAGLRRAQELAKDPAVSHQRRGSFAEIDFGAFNHAIDAEAARERT
jgi:hypothetical protein